MMNSIGIIPSPLQSVYKTPQGNEPINLAKMPKPLPSPSPSASDGADESVYSPTSPLSLPPPEISPVRLKRRSNWDDETSSPKKAKTISNEPKPSTSTRSRKIAPKYTVKGGSKKEILKSAPKFEKASSVVTNLKASRKRRLPEDETESSQPSRKIRVKLAVKGSKQKAASPAGQIYSSSEANDVAGRIGRTPHATKKKNETTTGKNTESVLIDAKELSCGTTGEVHHQTDTTSIIQDLSKTVTPATPESSCASSEGESDVNDNPFVKRAAAIGLRNLGQTCYNNAVVQALCSSSSFRKGLEEYNRSRVKRNERVASHRRKTAPASSYVPTRRTRRATQMENQRQSETPPSDMRLASELADLIDCIIYEFRTGKPSGKRVILDPHEFGDACSLIFPHFQRHVQQDAQEFLVMLLDRLAEETAIDSTGDFNCRSPITTLFQGQYRNTNECKGCPKSSTKTEAFLDLSFDIPQAHDIDTAAPTMTTRKSGRSRNSSKPVQLKECLDLFAKPEVMQYSPCASPEPKDAASVGCESPRRPACPDCKMSDSFTKTIRIEKCPKILCVHLKRFQFDKGISRKISTHVQFPVDELDVAPWMVKEASDTSTKYRLCASIVHEGEGLDGGHYMTYGRRDDAWWRLNDDKCNKVTPQEVADSSAYLLVYERIDEPLTTAAS